MNTTKRRIFETSIKLFAQKGYEATSVEEITSVVGVAKGTLYYHFTSKEELFNELVKDGIDFLMKSIDIKLRNTNDVIEKIRIIIVMQIKVLKKFDQFMILIFSQLWGGENRNEFVRNNIESYIKKLEEVIIEGKEKNIINVDDTRIVANLIFGQFSSVLVYQLNNGKNFNAEELGEKYLKILLEGIK